jgi:hypothetical protein
LFVSDPLDQGELEKDFGKLLLTEDARKGLEDGCEMENSGVRLIEGSRYELLLSAGEGVIQSILVRAAQHNDVFGKQWANKGAGKLIANLVERAKEQARKETRVPNGHSRLFHNFSVIVTYGPSKPQVPHVDLTAPNYQYGKTLHDETPGTIVYRVPRSKETKTADQLISVLSEAHGGDPEPNWNDKARAIANDIMIKYGNVLAVYLHNIPGTHCDPLPASSLMSLGGGIPHGGPSCVSSRAILFFSSYDASQEETKKYDRDVQFISATLLYYIIGQIWAELEDYSRRWFLAHLTNVTVGMAELYGKGCVVDHVVKCPCSRFLAKSLSHRRWYGLDKKKRMSTIQNKVKKQKLHDFFFLTGKEAKRLRDQSNVVE